ncbi:TPA: LamG domain-containing protein [Candidatus Poribacteria bacterium]|nr:LamG domain-containing protein [Candidatus Poribacteria bacterium]
MILQFQHEGGIMREFRLVTLVLLVSNLSFILKRVKMKNLIFCIFAIVLLAGSYASAAIKNMALELKSDPNSFFEAPDNPVFHQKLGDTFTAEAWVFSMDQVGERMIVNKEDSYEFALRNNGMFEAALKVAGAGWDWHSSGVKVENEKWTHVAITWDGKVVRMFVDGKKAPGEKDMAGTALNVTDSTFKVGRRERGGETHSIFDGLIDEVRISKGLRYTGDYALPKGAFEPDADTMALYHFDEAVGGVIKDHSKSGIDGKLVGKAQLVKIDLPNTQQAVEARGKLATLWGRLKAQ